MTISYYLPQRSTSQRSAISQRQPQENQSARDTDTFSEHESQTDYPPPEYTCNIPLNQDEKQTGEDSENHKIDPIHRSTGCHTTALEELTTRPASPPAFPSSLPQRKETKILVHRWKIIMAIALLSILLTTIVLLAILLALSRHHIQSSTVGSAPDDQTKPMTLTQTITRIETQTQVPSTFITITMPALSFPSPSPSPTSTTQPQSMTTSELCTSPILSLSPTYCVFTTCNVKADETQNCKDFCRFGVNSTHDGVTTFDESGKQNLCKNVDSFIGDTRDRIKGCCGMCGCF